MGKSSTTKDAQALFQSLRSAYSATPTNLKIIDLYVMFAVFTALIQRGSRRTTKRVVTREEETAKKATKRGREDSKKKEEAYLVDCGFKFRNLLLKFALIARVVYMAVVGSFPFNSFLSGVLSCVGTAVLAICLRIQVNKENKEFKDLPPERAFADFVLCNLVLHLVIMNFLG
ncbi:unnamed protein product [Camellia sinensis]